MSRGAGFLRPGTQEASAFGISFDVDRDTADADVGSRVFNRSEGLEISEQRRRLPIYRYKRELLYLLEEHQCVVVVGETGSGKTTQILQFLDDAGWTAGGRLVACTQPRRVAAMSVARRVAEEMGCRLGGPVGYSIRFEDVCTPGETRLRFCTDGVLLREMLDDPLLSKYSVVMVDEAHERSIATDVLLGLLRKVLRRRPELRVIVSSATIDAGLFMEFFALPDPERDVQKAHSQTERLRGRPAALSVEGRLYPVQVHYLREPASDFVREAVETVLRIHREGTPGDVLVFLTGQEDCEAAVSMAIDSARRLHNRVSSLQLMPVALYAGLPWQAQVRVFEDTPRGKRKVVFSTNIAETSVTIEGVTFVVDCCFSKQRVYDPLAGLESLLTAPISKQSAVQRAGRAGRLRPGHCFRLCTEDAFRDLLPPQSVPEMQRSELSSTVLQLKALGVDSIMSFAWLSPPPSECMVRALESLFALGALDRDAHVTSPLGAAMSELPTVPALARALCAASELGCGEEVVTIAAVLSVHSPWMSARAVGQRALEEARAKFWVAEGDLITHLNVWEGWNKSGRSAKWSHRNCINHKAMLRVSDIRAQLCAHMRRLGLRVATSEGGVDVVLRALVAGFFMSAAVLTTDGGSALQQEAGAGYRLVRSRARTAAGDDPPVLRIGPASVLFRCRPEWVVFATVAQGPEGVFDMQDVAAVDPRWLTEAAPHFFRTAKVQPGDGM
ncbi:unnamed protein product [Pedinophyceae sp. YPF-701]|nr:unnamed protein product [Pedinophyceae sp. YPF-701]